MQVRQEIMALPAAERLDYAIELLEELTGDKYDKQMWLKEKFGFTAKEARLFLLLNNNAPRILSREVIYKAIWGESDVEIKIVDVMVCKIRKKGAEVKNYWGIGYSIDERIEVGNGKIPEEVNRLKRWTADNDNDLILMFKNGSSLRSMAYELERTERGVNERIMRLKAEGRLA